MRSRSLFWLFLIISSFLHVFFAEVLFRVPASIFQVAPRAVTPPIEVSLIPKASYQIADIDRPKKEERPDQAKFLGEYDSKVEEEQVGLGGPRPSKPRSPEVKSSAIEKDKKEAPKKDAKVQTQQEGEGPSVAMKTPPVKTKPLEPSSEDGGDGQEENLFEGSGQDFFPDYKVGNKTYLNVFRFPKVTYFVRLKKIIRITWNPRTVDSYLSSLRFSQRQIQSVVGVSINRRGQIEELLIIKGSGLKPYDDEALRALRDSSPFAAPPENLLDANGLLRIAYTFVYYF